jgi:hypothetical protein
MKKASALLGMGIVMWWAGTVLVFGQNVALEDAIGIHDVAIEDAIGSHDVAIEDAIGSHACWLQAAGTSGRCFSCHYRHTCYH